ncbi:MAG TPA: DHA2 family efflux MFS transporter permease subunit [Nitrolancea sp.]|nr:DHA2 family efflux MFS transporter permease subunit [Nitrolancea sp.]
MARSASRSQAIDGDVLGPVTVRQIAIFVTVSLALLMSSIDSTIVAVGLPNMMNGLHTNLVWIGWVLTGYSLTQTMILPMAGKFSDDFGRKRLFLACVVLFTTSSLLCSIAPNVYILILCRVLQAVGGGAFMPSAAGIVSDVFGPQRRSTAIGLFTSVFPIGGIVGPNVGGWVIDHFGWRAIFAVNVPIGVVLFLVGIVLLPAGGRSGTSRGIDLIGALSFGFGIAAFMYGMTVWGNNVTFDFQVALWMAAGLAALIYFLRHEARAVNPMIEIRLLKERAFFAANLYNFLYGSMVFGFFSFLPLYATMAYGMSATQAGFILTPRAIAMISLSAISSFLLIRFGYRLPMIIGVIFVSASLFLVSQGWHNPVIFGHQLSNLGLLSILIAIGGLGVGIGGPAANNAAIELMPEAVARITGLRGMFRNTGGVLGTASIVLYMAHQQNQALGMEKLFLILSVMVLLVIPPVFLIPDGAASRRKAAAAAIQPLVSGE